MKKLVFICLLIFTAAFISFHVNAEADLTHVLTSTQVMVEEDLYTFENIDVNDVFQVSFTASVTGNYVIETFGNVDTKITFNTIPYDDNTGYGSNEIVGFAATANQTYTFYVEVDAIYGLDAVFVQVRRQSFGVFTVQDPITVPGGVDTSENASIVYNLYNGANDNMYEVNHALNFTLAQILATLDDGMRQFNSEYVVYSSHGQPGHYTYKSGTSYIYTPSTTLPDMSNTKLAIWSACYSGSSGPDLIKPWITRPSVAESAHNNGADISIGWTGPLDPERVAYFNNYFLNALIGNTTQTILDLCEEAAWEAFYNSGSGDDFITEYVIYGDSSTIMNLSDPTPNEKASTTVFVPADDLTNPPAPSVITGSVTKYSAAFTITNNSDRYLMLYAEHSDTTPDVFIKVLAPNEVYVHTFTGLYPSCHYDFYFQFKDYYRPTFVSSIVHREAITPGGGIILW